MGEDFIEGLEEEKPTRFPCGKSREKKLNRTAEDLRLHGPFSERAFNWKGNWRLPL